MKNTFSEIEKLDRLENFHYGAGTESYKSCSAQFNGELYIFGGFYESRQISKIEPNCKLRRVGTLPFDFVGGTCNSFDNKVLLCFPLQRKTGKFCWVSYNGLKFKLMKKTNYNHWYGQLGIYKGSPFAIAGNSGLTVEMHTKAKWSILPSIPARHEKLYAFSTVTIKDIVFVFGGDDGNGPIAENWAFSEKWERVTPLLQARSGHRSIILSSRLYHIGGIGNKRHTDFNER